MRRIHATAAGIQDYRKRCRAQNPPQRVIHVEVSAFQGVIRNAVLDENNAIGGSCNLHSWSDARPDLWVGMCYTSDHANADLMWSKPSEITGGIYF